MLRIKIIRIATLLCIHSLCGEAANPHKQKQKHRGNDPAKPFQLPHGYGQVRRPCLKNLLDLHPSVSRSGASCASLKQETSYRFRSCTVNMGTTEQHCTPQSAFKWNGKLSHASMSWRASMSPWTGWLAEVPDYWSITVYNKVCASYSCHLTT